MLKKIKIITLTKEKLREKFKEIRAIDRLQMKDFEKWQRENFFRPLRRKFQLSCLAIKDNQVVGYNIVSQKNKTAHIHRIAVHPHETGQGIGSKMLRFSQKNAQEKGLEKMMVETFQKGKFPKFYFKNNFKKMTKKDQKIYVLLKEKNKRKLFLEKYCVFIKNLK